MAIEHNYQLGDILELKKEHPCSSRSRKWKVIRLGADIKISCLGCGNIVMLSRFDLNKRIKKVLPKE